MSVKKILAYLSILGILLIILLKLIFGAPSKNDIKLEIQRANYCGSSEDCVSLENAEQITCTPYVNSGETDRVQELVNAFKSKGESTCGEPVKPSCVQFQCK